MIMAKSQRGKGVLMAESEVLKDPDIPDTTHEFSALLQFATTYELMEFFTMQQIKVLQRMAEEHAQQRMIECVHNYRYKRGALGANKRTLTETESDQDKRELK